MMDILRAVIIEDETRNITVLKSLLAKYCPQVEICGEALNTEKAIQLINEVNPNLIFLDVEMPRGNAFDMLDQLMPVNFEIIFVTAFNEYTLRAIKYSALDYLLKPVSIKELKEAVQKAEYRIRSRQESRQLHNFLSNHHSKQNLQKIALPFKDALVFVPLVEIIRCEAKGNCCNIFATDKRKYLVTNTIKDYEEILPGDIFFRIHNSHIINLNWVKKYIKGRGGLIEMDDGAFIEVATRRKEEFLERFGYK